MQNNHDNKLPPKVMIKLYGESDAIKVNNLCHQVDEFFGEYVAEFVYDVLWEKPPLNYLEKALVTVTSLIVVERIEQLKVLVKIPLHLGKDIHFVLHILAYLHQNRFIYSPSEALEALQDVTNHQYNLLDAINKINPSHIEQIFSKRELALIHLSGLTTKGNSENIKDYYKEVLNQKILSTEDIGGVLRHQMIYCGCPCTMSGFAWLNEVTNS